MSEQKKVGAWGSRHGKGVRSWAKRKREKRSATPGSAKGPSCQTDTMKSYFAKRGRSYKHRGYSAWCKKMDRMNSGAGAKT